MAPRDLTPDEMVAVIYDRSERIEKALYGNGQPGLIDRVVRVEERMDERNRAAAKAAGAGTLIGALLTTLLGWLSSAVR